MKRFMYLEVTLKNLKIFLGFRGGIMKKDSRDLFFVLFVSGIIGFIIGFIEVCVDYLSFQNVMILLRDVAIGVLIGFISRAWFMYLYSKKKINVKFIFFVVFITIGLISVSPAIFDSVFKNSRFFSMRVFLIFIVAEILGLGFTYYLYAYTYMMNKKLLIKKNEILKDKNKYNN